MTVKDATKVLSEGTSKQIESVQSGEQSVATVAAAIREREKKQEELTDAVGRIIPKDLCEDWLDAMRVGKEVRSAGLAWKRVLDQHLACGDKYRPRHNLCEAMSKDIGQLVYELSCTIPHAVCPFCQGLGKRCEKCHSRGWLSKSYWRSFVPEKLGKMFEQNTSEQIVPAAASFN